MKVFVAVCVWLSLECITGLDPALDGDPRQTSPARRAIDGSRGRKYYVPEEGDTFEIYGFGGQYDPHRDTTDFSDIRINVPGEPGVDYPSYITIPQTSFRCQSQFKGYYADEEAGCQLFHVCDSNFLVSSFLCPIGSIFSQKLLTCDWWNKVDCSSTRNYYIANRESSPTEVDGDEFLRRAYEMTSLQTLQKGISIDFPTRNSIVETARFINDLQTSPINYGDYADDLPDGQYNNSSRFNSRNDQDRGSYYPMFTDDNQRTQKIRVHTIGQDNKNDADELIRDSRPSYVPTVPTVTTTTRRYYSPTIPTTSARPMSRPGHDLEFESSNHLYSARGKTSETSTSFPVRKSMIDTPNSVVVDVLSIPSDISHPKIEDTTSSLVGTTPKVEIVTETSEITMDKSHLLTEFSAIEYQSLYSGENYTFQIDVDDLHSRAKQTAAVEIPSTHIIPPFLYYSNIDQHNAASIKGQDTNSTSSKQFIINVSATIPPLFNDFYNGTAKNYMDNQGIIPTEEVKSPFSKEIINSLPIIQNAPKIEENGSLIDNSILAPSKLFLPPSDDFQLSTIVIPNNAQEGWDRNNEANRNDDSIESESSPVVKGEKFNPRSEVSKSLIAKHDSSGDVGDLEIEKLQQITKNWSVSQNTTTDDLSATGDVSRAQMINYTVFKKMEGIHPLRSLSTLQDADHFPRPFSLAAHRASRWRGKKFTSENSSQEHEELREKKEIPQLLAQTFDHSELKTDAPSKFELPHMSRTIDFRSGKKIKNSEEQTSGEEEEEKKEDQGEHKRISDQAETSVDTKFIPSIGFSLKEYTEAVIRGFFTDLSIPSVNKNRE